ncbi:MAG: methyltransferase domain-containing protein [Chromatiales bacterium]|jgi:predicted SAM-dependent methyltransferase|nr:methyltransferase domain-containing protein [Chromatiales bacterium]
MNEASKPVRRLHIGGHERREGWEIFDALPREGVDHRGDAADLSRFPDGTFAELYASHVLEHFDFREAVPRVLKEWHRVLQPGGRLYISVPDMERLCHLYLTPGLYPEARLKIMWMMFGTHADPYDYHFTGFNGDYLGSVLGEAGFSNIQRVLDFGVFKKDTSTMVFLGVPISVNLTATR